MDTAGMKMGTARNVKQATNSLGVQVRSPSVEASQPHVEFLFLLIAVIAQIWKLSLSVFVTVPLLAVVAHIDQQGQEE